MGDVSNCINIATGSNHTIILCKSQTDSETKYTILTWGDNTYGQLGVHPTQLGVPTQLPGIYIVELPYPYNEKNIKGISCSKNAGFVFFEGTKNEGTKNIIVWGDNNMGKLSITDENYERNNDSIVNPIENVIQETEISFDISFSMTTNQFHYISENNNLVLK